MNFLHSGPSPIAGLGLFATAPIRRGQHIRHMTGVRVTLDELYRRITAGSEAVGDGLQIGDELYVDLDDTSRLINHRCDPNAWIVGTGELRARRDISALEEITYDYSTTMWEDKEHIRRVCRSETWTMTCSCGAAVCRGLIDQFYLLPAALQCAYLEEGGVPDFIRARASAREGRFGPPGGAASDS